MPGEYRFAGPAQEQFQRASPQLQARMRRVAATIVSRLDSSPQTRSRGISAETVEGFDVVYNLDVEFPYPTLIVIMRIRERRQPPQSNR